ncbi:MAG: hypothetical protein QG577_2046 [Thermodesulfobacteriota bacterium]|nr:hypothetical protein [Thermodesulfobacteriota bacterium]
MKLSPWGLLRKTVGTNRQTESLVQFKPLRGLPEVTGINEEDIPWAVIVEDKPGSGISQAQASVQRRTHGAPPIPVLVILPIMIALMALVLAE